MARRLVVTKPGHAELADFSPRSLADGEVRLRTLHTGLSAGTELTWFKGTNPYLAARWDAEVGLFRDGEPGQEYPVERLGYMEVGQVVETRSQAYPEGSVVAAAYGHATEHVLDPRAEHAVILPAELDPLLGIYVAHMGPICANGLLHAAAEAAGASGGLGLDAGVRGRSVLVTGAGVVGLLTALFAAEHGAAEIVVADADQRRLAVAEQLGFVALDAGRTDIATVLKDRWRHGRGDHGADVAFQCRGRPGDLAIALRSLRPQGAVIDLAFYQDGAADVRLGEEFHHNGLALRCAQVGRVPRGLAGWWDRRRLSLETIALLAARGEQVRSRLITNVIPLAAAPSLLADLAERRRHVLQAVFEPSE
jgi:threonine dehydrogenase-like Zn-dependent dehydrogenase